MAVCARNSDGEPIFETTILVPNSSSTHHTHFSLGKRIEGGVRGIVTETHPLSWCYNPTQFSRGYRLNRGEMASLVHMNFPIDQVTDWTEEEAELISAGLCPETSMLYQERMAFNSEMQQLLAEEAEFQRTRAERARLGVERSTIEEETVEDDFPLEFQDEDKCPACLEDEYTEETYLLRLPCGHTLCKGCLKGVENKCPKCRKGIDRSLIKRKK